MKKAVFVLAVAVAFLLGFNVREYVLAPNNVINGIKSHHALEKVQDGLVVLYRVKGEKGVEDRCNAPIEESGYWFTCYPTHGLLSEGDKEFFTTEAGVFQWHSKIEAEEIAVFRNSVAWRRSNIYRVGGEGLGDPSFYLDATKWAAANFLTLDKRVAKPEDARSLHEQAYP